MSEVHSTPDPDMLRDVIIIGSGPAGYTAAVYAARANLSPVLFEGSVTAGGALMNTTEVENFPGFPEAIMGPNLMDAMRAQAERFGAHIIRDDVTRMSLDGPVKTVTDGEGVVWSARTVILAMGSAYRKMGLPDEGRLSGHGVSWCATCDGFFFRDQDIAVVGGGDSALEEAAFLTKFARSVTIVHRRDELRASKIMAERAMSNPTIGFAWNSAVETIHGPGQGRRRHPARHRDRSNAPAAGVRCLRRDRSRPSQRAHQGRHRPGCRRLRQGPGSQHADQRSRGVRLRRPGRPHLSPGHHRRRLGLRRRPGRRTLPQQPRRDTPFTGKHGTSGMRAASWSGPPHPTSGSSS